MLFAEHMWNITNSGHCSLLSAIWPGKVPAWEEVLWETTLVSVFCITQPQSAAISPQLSLFVYLIYWRMPKRNRCSVLVPLFYSTPLCKRKGSGLESIELSECIIVIYGNLTFKLSFATKHYFQFSWGEGRGTERENELMLFIWTDPKDRWETWEYLWTSTFFYPAMSLH